MRLTQPTIRSIQIGTVAIAVAITVAALAIGLSAPRHADQFWATLRFEGREVEHYSSLLEMMEAADAVVLATVSEIEMGRTIQGDADGDFVTYARIELNVVKVISGSVPNVVPLEFLVGINADGANADMEALKESAPSGTALYFLHAKRGSGEKGLYRVTNSSGLWAETARSRLDAPLQELPPGDSDLHSVELASIRTVDELAGLLIRYVSRE